MRLPLQWNCLLALIVLTISASPVDHLANVEFSTAVFGHGDRTLCRDAAKGTRVGLLHESTTSGLETKGRKMSIVKATHPKAMFSASVLPAKALKRQGTVTLARSPPSRLILEKFRATSIILPVLTAAKKLEDFYDIIAMKVETGFYANIPPLHNLVLKRWDYELSFFCYAAPIPWEFIQEVALEMSEWAQKGFTPEYEMLYKAVDALGKDIVVTIVFRLGKGGRQ